MKVNLFYLADPPYGGWPSYTLHLKRSFLRQGIDCSLFKVGLRTESKSRPMLDSWYRRVDLSDALRLSCENPSIVTCVGPKYGAVATHLFDAGALGVVHDPTELTPDRIEAFEVCRQLVVIRPANLYSLASKGLAARYIPHPYVRAAPNRKLNRRFNAVAISRLDWDKHTDIIVAANDLLPRAQRCALFGAENRLYTHHKLEAQYPLWRRDYHGRHPAATLHAGVGLARDAVRVVDMSAIAGDGGGTQYTFLEAWDAESQLVVNRAWVEGQPEGAVNARTATLVHDAESLARALQEQPNTDQLCDGLRALETHAPERVVPEYVGLLQPN